jgi:hypothetical protein
MSGRAGHRQLPCECHDRMCVRYVGKIHGLVQDNESCFGEFPIDRSANPMRCTNNRLASSNRYGAYGNSPRLAPRRHTA